MNGFLRRAMFEAPWWAVFVNPWFLPRRALWRAMQRASGQLRGRILDLGCGVQPYRQLLTMVDAITGLEIDTDQNRKNKCADVYYDGATLPFDAESFDGVVCNQVLEHVFEPESFIAEIRRVLVADGKLVLSVPFVWPEHERPWDSQRYTSYGVKELLQRGGFEVIEQEKLVGGGSALMALVAERVNASLRHLPLPVRLAARAFAVAPLSGMGALIATTGRGDPEFYLDNFLVARRRA